MQRALELACLGRYTTDPNPSVGCVIVKEGRIVGEGWHQYTGQDHAEVIALKAAGDKANNATAYVTLEPCSHFGRTPPCVDSLLEHHLQRVVVASTDPNSEVSSKGIKLLQQKGIIVEIGLMEQKARALNQGFFQRMQTGRPRVTLKIGASLDGRTAMASGESQWISSEVARQDVHRLRASSSAIVTGIGTVLADNPTMTARITEPVVQPLRVVVDSNRRTPADASIVGEDGKLLIACIDDPDASGEYYSAQQVDVVAIASDSGKVDLNGLLSELGRREINEVLVEAGQTLSGSFLSKGLVDQFILYLAPKILGNRAKGMFDLPQLSQLQDAFRLEITDIQPIGDDIRVTANVV